MNREGRRGRGLFLALVALFFGPWLLAYLYYIVQPDWRPPSASHGELIQPPVPIADLLGAPAIAAELEAGLAPGEWLLLLLLPAECGGGCAQWVYDTGQMRKALGRDSDRLTRLALRQPGAPAPDDVEGAPAVLDLPAPAPPALELAVGSDRPAAVLMDAEGRVMMRYGPDHEPRGMLEDIDHLMEISHAP